MEVVFIEDPACPWCWAFQPAETAFLFEFGDQYPPYRVMGGLRDHPIGDEEFQIGQWELASRVSGMPFESSIWQERTLQTTHVACEIVKAASLVHSRLATPFVRRLREALFLERRVIDQVEDVLALASEIGIEKEKLLEHCASGRARTLFARDRDLAANHGFGFPTTLIVQGREESKTLLEGVVPYDDLVKVLLELGVSDGNRRRFHDCEEDWERLFRLRPRLTMPEILEVTSLESADVARRLEEFGAGQDGHMVLAPSRWLDPRTAWYGIPVGSWSRPAEEIPVTAN